MIYTVGNGEEYEKGIAEKEAKGERLLKRGPFQDGHEKYRGGAVWETREGAQAFVDAHLEDGLAVFGVEADWGRHTFQYDGEEFQRLLVDKPLTRLP